LLVDVATRKPRLTGCTDSSMSMTIHMYHGTIRLSAGEGRGVR